MKFFCCFAKASDPFKRPAHSFFNRFMRIVWWIFYIFLFRPSPRICYAYRASILRLFGAKIGSVCNIYPKAVIWAPWNLECEDAVAIADGAEIYNPAKVTLRSHAIISQGAFICTASHDLNSADFELFSRPIVVGRYAWICSRASVLPGVTCGDGAVLGLGGVTSKDLLSWSIYAGNPAKKVGDRKVTHLFS